MERSRVGHDRRHWMTGDLMVWRRIVPAVLLAALFSLIVKSLAEWPYFRKSLPYIRDSSVSKAHTYMEGKTSPDAWNGLVLNQSTVQDALNTLGQPESDAPGPLDILGIYKALTPRCKENIFRLLRYRNPAGLSIIPEAELAFLDGRLAAITLHVAEDDLAASAAGFRRLYGDVFTVYDCVSGHPLNPKFLGFWRRNNLPSTYCMAARTEHRYVTALVRREGLPDSGNGMYPGFIRRVQLISRELEAKNADKTGY